MGHHQRPSTNASAPKPRRRADREKCGLAPGSQARGLAAGANVITVNFSGEADQARYPIYGSSRFVVRRDYALRTLESAGLEPRLGRAAFEF